MRSCWSYTRGRAQVLMILLMVSADSAVRELTPFPGAPIARVGIRRVIERMDDTVVPPNFLLQGAAGKDHAGSW